MYLLNFCFESRKLSKENRKRIYIYIYYWVILISPNQSLKTLLECGHILLLCINDWYIYERLDGFISWKISVFLVLFYTWNNQILNNKKPTPSWNQSLMQHATEKKNERASSRRRENPAKPFTVFCHPNYYLVINLTEKQSTKC